MHNLYPRLSPDNAAALHTMAWRKSKSALFRELIHRYVPADLAPAPDPDEQKRTSLSVTEEELAQLDLYAKHAGLSRNEAINRLIECGFADRYEL